MSARPRLVGCLFAAAIAWGMTTCATPAAVAQSWAPLAASPDSALTEAIAGLGGGYETIWNDLLVGEIEASLAGADSARRLGDLARRIARAERGTRIAADAYPLRQRWTREQLVARVRAARDEAAGSAAASAREFARADSFYIEAIQAYRGLEEKRRLAWVWGSRGVAAFSGGRYGEAIGYYRGALTARRAIGDERMIGNSLNALGSTNLQLGRVPEAYDWYQQARAVRERTGETAALGTTLNYMGMCARALGRPDSAVVWFDRALALTVASGDSLRTTSVLVNYAIVLREQRNPRAIALYDRARAIARANGDAYNEAVILESMGLALAQEGRYTEAIERLEAAVPLAEQVGRPEQLASVLNTLGFAWLSVKDPERGRAPLVRALSIADSVQSPLRARVLVNLSGVALQSGDPTGAEGTALDALAAATAAGDSVVARDAARRLGQVAFQRGEYDRARHWFERCVSAGAGLGAEAEVEDLVNLGSVASLQNRIADAARHFDAAAARSRGGDRPDLLWPALLGLGDARERAGDVPGALVRYRQAAAIIDTLRGGQDEAQAITAFARRLFAYEALIHLLTKADRQYPDSGFAAEAFLWAERARARSVLDLMASSGRKRDVPAPLGIREAQALMGPKEMMLSYSLGDSSSSLWIVRADSWRHVSLPPRSALTGRVTTLRRSLATPDGAVSRAARRAARSLYATLVGPAETFLEGSDHLIVSPDGVLAFVPFEVLLAVDLPNEEDNAKLPKRAYLVERVAISYAPSATALAGTRGREMGGGIVAVGDPLFARNGEAPPRPELVPLPYTAAELAALEQSARKRDIVLLVGADATRDRLLSEPMLADARVIHIATHGEANEQDPAHSGLWLGVDRNGEPGFLGVPDILQMDLAASMVTLSACETGLGRLERGEGVLGLTRAFLAAGAHSVVVSLWKVNDRSTARLMERFYRLVLGGGTTRAVALAHAKRDLLKRKETASPFFWAPFVLVGANEKL